MKIVKYFIIFFVLLILSGSIVGGYFTNEFFLLRPDKSVIPISFTVEKGSSLKKISFNLAEADIIKNKFIFEFYIRLLGLDEVFQPGDYSLKPGISIASLAKIMTTVNINEKRLTIIEGWTLKDIATYLLQEGVIKNENELYQFTGRPGIDYRNQKIDFIIPDGYAFLNDKPVYATLEGYIYPDTYKILTEGGVKAFLKKVLDNFDRKLTPELRKEIENQDKAIYEIVIKASILEKEVISYEDRRLVSGIIDNRIKIGMALQMDSTVNYVTNSGRTRSTYDDLQIDSPWNTYKYQGLPLGPISNPDITSIRATIYPELNNYFYFLTDKEGKVYYGKTGAEHLVNRKYLDN